MIVGTTYVMGDEPAINLAEVNLQAPTGQNGNTDWYRFQIILVWRDDKPTEYRERLGLAKDFKAHQFRIMGGVLDKNEIFIEETVNTLKEHADIMRNEPVFDLRQFVMEREKQYQRWV